MAGSHFTGHSTAATAASLDYRANPRYVYTRVSSKFYQDRPRFVSTVFSERPMYVFTSIFQRGIASHIY